MSRDVERNSDDKTLPGFSVAKKRDGFLVRHMETSQIDFLDFHEGIIYRITGRLPKRFRRWHELFLKQGGNEDDR